ncbi:MAG: D-alanyl-D-alanine carboxypeptidase, partial [Parvularculaceae bacterium]|nr:D-alanyl-D-alanine carboxypeptidase [Parvularculaceae bacterium]
MQASLRFFSVFLGIFVLLVAAADPAEAARKKRKYVPPAPKYSALVVDAQTGAVLYDRFSDELRIPASLTKMMTLYMLFGELEAGRLKPDSPLAVSARAQGQPPSKLGLVAGETIDVESAIKALVVNSANDVAVVIAEEIGGSETRFAQRMTEKARVIGMKRTTFRNASGLPNAQQRSTAKDLATLGRRLMHDYPQYYHYFSTTTFAWNGRTYRTHNQLVRSYPGAEGLKTGYTRLSGFNLVTSAHRDGRKLV